MSKNEIVDRAKHYFRSLEGDWHPSLVDRTNPETRLNLGSRLLNDGPGEEKERILRTRVPKLFPPEVLSEPDTFEKEWLFIELSGRESAAHDMPQVDM